MTALPGDIIEAMTAPEWWGPWFRRGDWSRWHAFLAAIFGLPLDGAEAAIYHECTGREDPPAARAKEAWAIIGRRGGKTRIMSLIAAWLAAFEDWQKFLAPGEVASVLLVAKDRRQATVAFRYIRSLFADHPDLRRLIVAETTESLDLSNRVVIEVATASFRAIRGYTIAALIADELAFWFDGDASANPAEEVIAAVRPAMLTMPNSMLLAASSPYARRGPLWQTFRASWAQPGPTLVWKAATVTMHPGVPAEEIERAYAEDPAKAAAEYGAEFRSDLADYVAREVVEALIAPGRYELPPRRAQAYAAFVDPSGGSSDSFTISIAHLENDIGVLDCIREVRPPFSPESVIGDFAALLRTYGIREVVGDAYAGEFPREQFRQRGIEYKVSERYKSDIYRELLPLLNSRRVELLDNIRLVAQLCGLERRTARGGRDTIDHQRGAHDDLANAAAGALVQVAAAPDIVLTWIKAFNPEALPRYLAKRAGQPYEPPPAATPPPPPAPPAPPELIRPVAVGPYNRVLPLPRLNRGA